MNPSRMGSACRALAFDLDGTLVDSETVLREALVAAAEAQGVTLPGQNAEGDAWRGIPLAEICASLSASAAAAERLEAEVRLRFWQSTALDPMPGVRELLRGVSRPRVVVTSARRAVAERLLRRAGLADGWRTVITADDVPAGRVKPWPDLYVAAASALAVPASAIWAFEDSPPGARAARAAGLTVVAVAPQPFAGPFDLQVNDLRGFSLPAEATT
jgi:HAD superfamily hydrolase (TIGR01509 family)